MPSQESGFGNPTCRRRKKIRPGVSMRRPSPTAPTLVNRIKFPNRLNRNLGKHSAVYPCKRSRRSGVGRGDLLAIGRPRGAE